jgi:type II secretory pathway pseudopilin PulG
MKLNKQNEPKIAVIGIAIIVTLVATPIVFVNYEVQAQTTASILTTQAARSQTRQVAGQGDSTNTPITCPNGQPPTNDGLTHINDAIQFSATQTNGQVSGTWRIDSVWAFPSGIGAPSTTKQGIITGGQITSGHFTLTGTETIDNTCGGPVPTQILISGKCGTASRITTVQFTAANGEKGTFHSSVVCT